MCTDYEAEKQRMRENISFAGRGTGWTLTTTVVSKEPQTQRRLEME